jgi:glycosyltransferase involved in cell wall biosynthesis
MNILYVCREVDDAAPFTAAQVQWITRLANRADVDHVHVLTPKAGDVQLPANVTLRQFAGLPWIRRAFSFWWAVMRARPLQQDFYFVAQGGPYPALLLPFKALTGRPLYQWKAQPHVSRKMRFYARHCNDLIFTATEQSLLLDLPTKRVIGHGIDTDLFRPPSWTAAPARDFVTVGRIAPIKNIGAMVSAIDACRHRFGVTPTLDIVGRTTGKDQQHIRELREHVNSLGLGDSVRFLGHVDYRELPDLLPRYKACLNLSGTAFDKSVGESMACSLPVLTSNACVIESLPADLRPYLVTDAEDIDELARTMISAMAWDDAQRSWLRRRVREFVVQEHSLETFFDAMFAGIQADRSKPINVTA